MPHRTVVNDYFIRVNADEINELLIHLFNWAKKNKIFYNHMEALLPSSDSIYAVMALAFINTQLNMLSTKKGRIIALIVYPELAIRERKRSNLLGAWFRKCRHSFPGGITASPVCVSIKSLSNSA